MYVYSFKNNNKTCLTRLKKSNHTAAVNYKGTTL